MWDLHAIQGIEEREPLTGEAGVEGGLEERHGLDATHQRAVIAVGAGATKGNEDKNFAPS